jgi:hypothetical protein
MYPDKLNEALELCATPEVPTVVRDALFELVQEVQAAKTQAQNVGTSTEKRCTCGKTPKK